MARRLRINARCERYDSYQRYELPSFRAESGCRRLEITELLPANLSGAYTGSYLIFELPRFECHVLCLRKHTDELGDAFIND